MASPLYRRSPSALFSSIGDDIVALHVKNGHCYGMEEVTAKVWQMLADPTDIDSICRRLLEDYDVEPSVCQEDVHRLISQLQSEGLIDAVGAK
jgi:hypothetical protein